MFEAPPDPLFVIRGDMAPIHCLLFDNANGEELIYLGAEDGNVHIWDLKVCKKNHTLKIGNLTCLSLHMIDKHLLTQDKECTLKVWKPVCNFECVLSQAFENLTFCRISVLRAELTYLAIPQPESVVHIRSFTPHEIQFVRALKYNDGSAKLGEVLHLKLFSSKRDHAAVMYESGAFIVWDLEGNAITYNKLISETPMAFDFDTSLMQGVCGTTEKNMIVFRLDENLKISKQKTLQITNPGIGSLCVRPDGKILAAGCWDGRIRIFSWKTCKQLAALDCHRESILYARFAHFPLSAWKNCNRILAVASNDKRISLWSIYD